jgi:hypothetical protein
MISLAQTFIPSFILPGLAIAGAVAMSVPIIIHILSKRPRKPEPWAAMKFLLAAYKKHRIRTRMEQYLLLATRCLMLLLLGCALAGPAWAALSSLTGITPRGRTLIVILDNGITSGAIDSAGKSRLDALKTTAGKLLDSLGPGDRVGLITTARPSAALVAPPTADPALVRRQVADAAAAPAASDIPGALRLALKTIEDIDDPSRPIYVALFSDFSAGAIPLEGSGSTLPPELAALGERATLVMTAPAASLPNVQIAALDADRRVVVADMAGSVPTVTWTIKLHRFSPTLRDGELSTVRLSVPDAQPIRQSVRWKEGQTEAPVVIATPLGQTEASGKNSSTLLPVEAVLEPGAEGTDALTVDNTRRALVRVRQKLVVMLLDRRVEETTKDFTPRRWLSTVLAPVADRLGWPIEVRQQDAGAVDAAALRDVDAVFVLRPDLLDDPAWLALRRWSEAGGLAWFLAPNQQTPSIWPQKMADTFGLPWAVTLEPRDQKPPLRLAAGAPAVAELSRLRADLADLARPIEFSRRLVVDPGSLGSDTDVMLKGENGEPLFISGSTAAGDGRVLLLASALDAQWTNLTTKPLFVPLIHESLRAAVDRLQPIRRFEPGDQPTLGGAFRSASRLTGPDNKELLLIAPQNAGNDAAAPIDTKKKNAKDAKAPAKKKDVVAGVTPIHPFATPGVYRSDTDALTVEIRPTAANTLAVDPAILRGWLGVAGTWLTFDAADPAAVMRTPSQTADWGWQLLWAVLALAVFETFLARYVSHAHAHERTATVMEAGQPAA